MLQQLRQALVMVIVLTILTGLIYPFAVTGIADIAFPYQARGSLVTVDGKVVGSALIGQSFADDKYFHGRPSATTDTDPADSTKTVPAPYNAANSAGSNLGPTSKALVERVEADVKALGATTGVPVDLVTASGSGLDPHISPAAAAIQVARVAHARNRPVPEIEVLVGAATEGRTLGLLGEPRVNVLKLNLALDSLGAR
jgi:K+-transporting ATPase ATPase C chain